MSQAQRRVNALGVHHIQQTIGADMTRYLLDLQPGLPLMIAETLGATTTRHLHAPRGIHAREDSAGAWAWMMQDGLGSVRGEINSTGAVLGMQNLTPYGDPFGAQGTIITPFAFTGEPRDPNGLLYLRARYYAPSLGIFPARDPFEGTADRAMSLNGYAWVEGNVVNAVDPSGQTLELANRFNSASSTNRRFNPHQQMQAIGCLSMLRDLDAWVAEHINFLIEQENPCDGNADTNNLSPCDGGPGTDGSDGTLPKPNRNATTPSNSLNFTDTQSARSVQHAFGRGHARDFGVEGNWNNSNRTAFENALRTHVDAPDTVVISGTYRGNIPVTHYYNPNSRLWAGFNPNGRFVAGWRLGETQIDRLFEFGDVR